MKNMSQQLHRQLSVTEIAALMDWSRWKASRWAKRHGIAQRDGRRVVVTLGRLLDVFPEAAASAAEVHERLGMARDFDALKRRVDSAEARVRALERALRAVRHDGRMAAQRARRNRNREHTERT